MLSLDDAWEHVRSRLPRLPAVPLPLAESVGLVLADGVTAAAPVPPFANSAVDGYAVRRTDVDGAPDGGAGLVLEVVAESAAGHVVDAVEPATHAEPAGHTAQAEAKGAGW